MQTREAETATRAPLPIKQSAETAKTEAKGILARLVGVLVLGGEGLAGGHHL